MSIEDIKNFDCDDFIYNKKCPYIVYEALYQKKDYYSLAICENTPPDILVRIFNEADFDLKAKLLANPNLPSELIEESYKKSLHFSLESFHIYAKSIASNKNTSPKILSAILVEANSSYIQYKYCEDDNIIKEIAKNPSTSNGDLDFIAKNYGQKYLYELYSNPSYENNITVKDIWERTPIEKIISLISNPNISQEILIKIYKVMEDCHSRPDLYRSYNYKTIYKHLVQNPKTPFYIIENYCKVFANDFYSKILLFENENIPLDYLLNQFDNIYTEKRLFSKLIRRHYNVEELINAMIKYRTTNSYPFNECSYLTNIIMSEMNVNRKYNISFIRSLYNDKYLFKLGFNDKIPFKSKLAFYYLLTEKYHSNSFDRGSTKELFNQIDKEIREGIIPDEIIYYMSNNYDIKQNLSKESLNIIEKIICNSNKMIPGSSNVYYAHFYMTKIKNQLLSCIDKKSYNDRMTNISDFIKDISISSEENKYITDFTKVQINKIKRNNYDKGYKIILDLDVAKLFKNRAKNGVIKAGFFPQVKLSKVESTILDILIKMRFIKASSEKFTLEPYFWFYKEYYVYIVNGRRFLKYNNTWFELLPIKWIIENNSLVTDLALCYINKKYHSTVLQDFLRDAIKQYSVPEIEKSKEKVKDINILQELETKKIKQILNKENDERKLNEYRNDLLKKFRYQREIVELDKKIEKYESENNIVSNNRKIVVDRRNVDTHLLLVVVKDHIEFSEDFKPFLDYIDLSNINCENLKVSGLDLSDTNLYLDPQLVYNKDLSDTIINGENLTMSNSFSGCNLRGARIIGKTDALGFEEAITDNQTCFEEKDQTILRRKL